jgi:hypothetical protein
MKNSPGPIMCLGEQGLKLPKEKLCSAKNKYVRNFVQSYSFHMNLDWIAFNYKVVAFFETFSNNRSQSLYKNEHEMVIVAKRFGTYVSLRNLGPFGEKVHCSSRKFPFLWGIYIFPRESYFLGNFICSLKKQYYFLGKLIFWSHMHMVTPRE